MRYSYDSTRRRMPTRQERLLAANLMDAVSDENIGLVNILLVNGANPEIPDPDGIYPLSLATFRGRLDIIRLLLDHGAGVDTRQPRGYNALQTATSQSSVLILRELLAAGADPNATDENDQYSTPLHWSARTDLSWSANMSTMRELIRAGARLGARDKGGYAPIHYAATGGNLLAVQELIHAGSDHTWVDDTGQTPLFVACLWGHSNVLKFLLEECKADPSATDSAGLTPLGSAAQRGHIAVVEMLLELEISNLGRDAYREALCVAAMCGNVGMMRAFAGAEGGVYVKDAKTAGSMTPLHYSAGYCHPVITRILLEAGGDENAEDSDGDTPFDVIDTMRSPHVVHGIGRKRVRRLLLHGSAYRSFSWGYPVTAAASATAETRPETQAPTLTENSSNAGVAGGGTDGNDAVLAGRQAEHAARWERPNSRAIRLANGRRRSVVLGASIRYARKGCFPPP